MRPKGSKNRPKTVALSDISLSTDAIRIAEEGAGRPLKLVKSEILDSPRLRSLVQEETGSDLVARPLQNQQNGAYIAPGEAQTPQIGQSTPEAISNATGPQNAPSERRLAVVDLDSGDVIGAYDSALLIRDDLSIKYSHSRIRTYNSCSAQSHFRNINAPQQPRFALVRGSIAHLAIELAVTKGADPFKVLADEWKVQFLDRLSEYSEKDQRNIAKEYGATEKMLRLFMEENSRWFSRSRPEDSEVEFDFEFDFEVGGRKFKRRLGGFIDQILWDKDRENYRILDYKSSAKAPPDEELALDSQFALYEAAATRLYGKPPDSIYYYLLRGELNCEHREGGYTCGGTDKHKHGAACEKHSHIARCYNFSFKIPLKGPEGVQRILNTYHGPNILGMEAGVYAKQRHDLRMCGGCVYERVCLQTDEMPLPKFSLT